MAYYPNNIASLTNPSGSAYQNAPKHSEIETTQNAEITAIETELGIGLKGSLSDLCTRLNISINADGTLKYESIINKTSNYTLESTDNLILCDTTNGSFIITLPTAIGINGKKYTIKKIDSSTNTVTITTINNQTIDGDSTQIIGDQYISIIIVSDGINWYIN